MRTDLIGQRVAEGARLAGRRADALFSVDSGEHRRRQALGMGSVTDLIQLDDALNHRGNDLAPAGLVLQVELVAGHSVEVALDDASLFAALAPTTVVVPRLPDRLNELMLFADARGVGLEISIPGAATNERLVEPSQPRGVFDAPAWAFHERAYERFLRER